MANTYTQTHTHTTIHTPIHTCSSAQKPLADSWYFPANFTGVKLAYPNISSTDFAQDTSQTSVSVSQIHSSSVEQVDTPRTCTSTLDPNQTAVTDLLAIKNRKEQLHAQGTIRLVSAFLGTADCTSIRMFVYSSYSGKDFLWVELHGITRPGIRWSPEAMRALNIYRYHICRTQFPRKSTESAMFERKCNPLHCTTFPKTVLNQPIITFVQ